eukprot:8651643-Alexandrium_andersonii.AAC.1
MSSRSVILGPTACRSARRRGAILPQRGARWPPRRRQLYALWLRGRRARTARPLCRGRRPRSRIAGRPPPRSLHRARAASTPRRLGRPAPGRR